MNVSAELYSAHNEFSLKTAQTLINKIKIREGKREYDLIVDIACGSGNVTNKFADNLATKRLVCVDIDGKMIEYAKKNNTKEEVDFLKCNMEVPWDLMSDQVQGLKGCSSLVYSCNALHWMTNVDTVVSNISQMMAPGAGLYILMNSLNKMVIPDDHYKDEFYSLFPMLGGDNLKNVWQSAFDKFGLLVDDWQAVEREFTFTLEAMKQMWMPMGKTLFKKYLLEGVDMDEVFKKFPDLMDVKKRTTPTGQFNADGQELWSMKTVQWVIVATKMN